MSDVSDVGRFDRMTRTDWIDMGRISSCRILVAGAGALGNEVLKDLVLAGFCNIDIVDPDTIEESNLSRCVLFRQSDVGRNKAEVASESAADLYSKCSVGAYACRVQNLELSGYDAIIGCLDNISARLHLNSHSRYFHIPYVDGATDGFRGKIQVILGNGPCMECMMNRTHANEVHRTYSCDPAKDGTITDPIVLSSGITTTSVIAASCVREVIKAMCGRVDLCIRGICYYDGLSGTMEVTELETNPDCPNHEGEL